MILIKVKQKRCSVKACRTLFSPRSSFHVVCSASCALIKIAEEKRAEVIRREKEYKALTRKMKADFNDNSKSFWLEKTKDACHEYIRLRDINEPCISCGTRKADLKYDAGHFIPQGRCAALRFEETNIHRQCSKNCNMSLSGNYRGYRIALVKKYGNAHVEWLEGPHEMPRYRIEDYKRIYAEFKAKTKQIKNR